MAPATNYVKQNGSNNVIIQNGTGSYERKAAIMQDGVPRQRQRRFGHVMPLMVSHMKDHKVVDFPNDTHSSIIGDPPFSSSTLLKDSSKKSPKTERTFTVEENADDFEQDSLENIADHIEHMHVSPKQTIKEETKNTIQKDQSMSSVETK